MRSSGFGCCGGEEPRDQGVNKWYFRQTTAGPVLLWRGITVDGPVVSTVCCSCTVMWATLAVPAGEHQWVYPLPTRLASPRLAWPGLTSSLSTLHSAPHPSYRQTALARSSRPRAAATVYYLVV